MSDRCIDTSVRDNGNNPVIQTDAEGNKTWTPYSEQSLCEPDSITFANLVANQTTQARDQNQRNKQVARSEEHTSELQSLMRNPYAVFCLKTKTNNTKHHLN